MNKILIAALVFAAGIGSATAQKPAKCPEQQQCAKSDCPRAAKACAANPFEGLNLTADQQAKIDAVKADCKTRCEQAVKERKKERAGRAEDFKTRRTEMLAKIKEILTPEQYVKFLENNFVNANNGRPGKPGKAGKEMRRDHR